MVKLVANFKYELTQGDINNLGNIFTKIGLEDKHNEKYHKLMDR